jgi:hypothetical protein
VKQFTDKGGTRVSSAGIAFVWGFDDECHLSQGAVAGDRGCRGCRDSSILLPRRIVLSDDSLLCGERACAKSGSN